MIKILSAICTLLLITTATFAQLEDLEFDGSNLLRWDNGREVDTRRSGLEHPHNTIARRFVENRLRLDLFSGDFRLGGRYLYFRPSEADVDQFRLEDINKFDKRFFEGQVRPLKFRFGHFSDIWASGLTLSMFENRDLYFDTEHDGARMQIDAGSIKLIGLTGKTEVGALVKEIKTTAGRIELSPGSEHLGFSYAYHDSGTHPEMSVAGVDWNLTRGIFNLYGERAWNEAVLQGHNSAGYATFVGLTVSKWGWSILAEYADYRYGNVTQVQNPPTVHREVTPRLLQGREPHVMNVPDEVGAQLEVSGMIGESTFLTAHFNANSHHSEDDEMIPIPSMEEKDRAFWDLFANIDHEFEGGQEVFVELGLNEEAANIWQERYWGQLRARFPLRGTQEVEFEVEQLMIDDKTRGDTFHDMLYAVSWVPNGTLSLYTSLQLTDDEVLKRNEGDYWASGEAAWKFSDGRHRAILFYGKERGGLKCSNGVCRQVQAFSGIRLTLETSL